MEMIEFAHCEELRFLQMKFSSGIRLHELRSVAAIVSQMTQIEPPERRAKRSYPLLVKWFKDNWGCVAMVLPLIQLRDAKDRVIDGRREMCERGIPFF
jgi:hypothetical protein